MIESYPYMPHLMQRTAAVVYCALLSCRDRVVQCDAGHQSLLACFLSCLLAHSLACCSPVYSYLVAMSICVSMFEGWRTQQIKQIEREIDSSTWLLGDYLGATGCMSERFLFLWLNNWESFIWCFIWLLWFPVRRGMLRSQAQKPWASLKASFLQGSRLGVIDIHR